MNVENVSPLEAAKRARIYRVAANGPGVGRAQMVKYLRLAAAYQAQAFVGTIETGKSADDGVDY